MEMVLYVWPSLDLLTIMDDAERDEVGTQAIGFLGTLTFVPPPSTALILLGLRNAVDVFLLK